MRPEHMAAVERQAQRVLAGNWKKDHTEFIDAIYQHHYEAMERLKQQPGGKEKIIKLYGIKNLKGYPSLQ